MVECTHMKHYTPLGCVIIGLIDMVRFTPALVRFTPALVRFTPWSVLPHPTLLNIAMYCSPSQFVHPMLQGKLYL